MCTVLDWEVIRREVLTAKLSHCSNDDYEVLKLEKLSRIFHIKFQNFQGAVKFSRSWKNGYFLSRTCGTLYSSTPTRPPTVTWNVPLLPLCGFSPAVDNHHHYYSYTGLTASFPGQPGQAGTRKIKPVWIKTRQLMIRFWADSSISWTICKQSAPRSRQTTTPTPHHSIFTGRTLLLTPNEQRRSTHRRQV